VLSDNDLAERLRQNGLRHAERFSMTSLAERYEDIYARVRSTTSTPKFGGLTPTGLIRRIIS
jgi:hypothetical protein